MHVRKLAALAAVVAAGAFGVAACGGNDDEAGSAAPAAQTAETSGSDTGSESTQIAAASPAADLRVTLDRLLAEHGELAVFAMQKGFDGSKDFEQIAAALDENTSDLGAAIGSVYGDDAEQAFLELWRAHIGFFVDYTVATAENDKAGRKAALEDLAGYKAGFSQFLADATGLPADALAEGLQMHVDQLTGALDAYAAGDYEAAYATQREAYEHMFAIGDTLADAIVGQNPAKFGGS